MPPMPAHKKRALAIGAAVAVPAALAIVYAAVKLRKKAREGKKKAAEARISNATAAEVKTFSEAEVSIWLRKMGVSDSTIDLFSHHGVDGATLLILYEGHLGEMGVTKLGDKLKLINALNKLRDADAENGSENTTNANAIEVAPSKVATKINAAAQPAVVDGEIANNETDRQRVAAVTQMVVQNLEELFGVFGSDEFVNLPPAQQKSLIAKADESYASVVSAIRRLPPAHQEKLLQFAHNFGQLLDEVKKAFGNAATSDGTLPEAASGQAVQQLLPLLKQFHEALESPMMVAAPLAQREEICGSILSQVVRMKQMTERLYPPHAEALGGICDRVIAIAEALLQKKDVKKNGGAPQPPARETATAAAAETAAAANPSTTPQILKRLRSIFEILKDPAFLDSLSSLPPKEIRAIVARMRGEINELSEETEVNVIDPQQRKLIGGVIDNVLAILSQVSMLGATKLDTAATPVTPTPQEPMGGDEKEGEAEQNLSSAFAALSAHKNSSYELQQVNAERANNVATRLKQILKILEDPQYRRDPTPFRQSIVEELTDCREVIAELPDETKLPLTQLMAKILEVFQMSLVAAQQQKARGGAAAAAAAPQKADEDEKEEEGADEDFTPSSAFERIKKSLEAVFAALSSDDFQRGERNAQNAFCQRLYGVLQQIESDIETKVVDVSEKEALQQLSASLTSLVEKLLESTGPSQDAAGVRLTRNSAVQAQKAETPQRAPVATKAKAPQVNNDLEGPRPVPITPQEAIAKVQDVKNILVNPNFGAMPPSDQLSVASGMLKDLKDVEAKITAACSLSLADPTAVPREYVGLYQQHVMPIVLQMRGAIEGLVGGLTGGEQPEEDEEDEYVNDRFEDEEEEEQKGGGGEDDKDDFAANPRGGLFKTVQRATELIHTGRISTIADVKECMALLQDVDKVGIETEAERDIRNEYMIAIRDLTQKMRDQNDTALKAKQAEYDAATAALDSEIEANENTKKSATAAPTATATDKKPATATKAGTNASRPKSIVMLVAKMRLILEDLEYRADQFNSLSELLPFMTTVEKMLGQFDSGSVSWKSDPEAVEVVSETLSRIQDIQEAIANKESNGSREPSELEDMLNQYTEMLEDGYATGGVSDRAHLAPFMEVVHQTRSVEGLTIEENKALMELQKAIISVSESLKEKMMNGERDDSDEGEEAEADNKKAASAAVVEELDDIEHEENDEDTNSDAHPHQTAPAEAIEGQDSEEASTAGVVKDESNRQNTDAIPTADQSSSVTLN